MHENMHDFNLALYIFSASVFEMARVRPAYRAHCETLKNIHSPKSFWAYNLILSRCLNLLHKEFYLIK